MQVPVLGRAQTEAVQEACRESCFLGYSQDECSKWGIGRVARMQSNTHGDHSTAAGGKQTAVEGSKYVTPDVRPTLVTPQRPSKRKRARADELESPPAERDSPGPSWVHPLIFVTPQRRPSRAGPSTPLGVAFSPPRVSTRSTQDDDKPADDVKKACPGGTARESSDSPS